MANSDHPLEADEHEEDDEERNRERTAAKGSIRLREATFIERGTVLADRYQIEQKLGEGGSGTVYRAWDRMLGEVVAIKILHPQRAQEKSWIRRLAREVKVARAIRHPNVCRVFELGNADGHWFVTLELATGGSLRDEKGPAPRPLAARVDDMRSLAAGLAAIHAVGIIHRDVTPSNVLRMADGRVVLTDFGLAIERDDQTTVQGGTPAYLPPEARGGQRSDQRSDVFQLGMILHEILHGVRPAWSSDGARLELLDPAPGASTVEEQLSALIEECVSFDPKRRPANAVAVAGRLAAAEAARPASTVVRLYARARRSVRRRARHFGIAGLAIAVGILLRVVQVASRPPLCRGAREQLAGVWDGTRATSIQKAFAGVGRTYAGDTFVKVRAMLDAYAREWADTYTEACEATNIRGEQSAEVLDLRMTCLKQERGELKAITDLFSSADGDVLARAVNAVSSLRSVAQCGDVSVLRAVVRLPDDRATRERVESLRPRLAEVKALFEAGHYRASIALAKPLVDEARQVAYDPVLAEALYMLGHSQWLGADFTGGEASLEEAMVRAEASRHDRVLAEAAVDMTSLLMRADRFEDLDRFSARARATVARLGGDLRLESWIDTSLASAMSAQGRAAQALEWNQRALEAKQRAFGPDHWDVAISLANVADDLRDLGRDAEAFATNERALRILEASLGTQHPMVAAVLANQCDARVALGEPARGRADCEHVLSIWKTEPPEREEFFGYPLTSIGLSFLAENRPVEAIAPLEEALRVRASDRARPELRADTAFALARARWSSGRDRSRAMKLAEEARDLYGAKKEAERKKVEAAMAEWRRGL